MDRNKIKNLLQKLKGDTLSDPERLILWMELGKPEKEAEIKALILELSLESEATEKDNPEKWEEVLSAILESDKSRRPETPLYSIKPKRKQLSWAAAAAILIILGTGSYFLFTKWAAKQPVIADQRPQPLQNDIAPGGNKAILYLAGGQKIILDSAKNGQLARLGGTTVTKTDSGKLIYAVAENNMAEPVGMNTLATPRGGIYQITLPDGTQAWLNAESSITYPTRFNQPERNVSVTGEVYFEVAKDVTHPFIVSLADKTKDQGESGHWMQVEVLGTHFNINAYNTNEDGLARTTLLEGSVKVKAHGAAKMIRPGEQAFTAVAGTTIGLNANVDLEKVMAWKNGEMVLTHGNVQQLMQDISRWYDVDIKYTGKIPEGQFSGSINRNVPLSSVLHVLKAYGVGTRLEGKTIIIE